MSVPGTRVRFPVDPGPKVEGLSDVELPELWLQVARYPVVDIREAMLTGDNITRTIEGASTVTIPVADREKKLLNSEYLQKGTEIEIDGLWFTLVAVEPQTDRSLKLTFEDSAVAELRDYPLESDPDSVAHLVRNSLEMTGRGVTRSQFAKLLVDEPGKRGDFPIGFVAPEYVNPNTKSGLSITGGVPDAVRGRNRQPGFPADANVTVKHKPATPAQLAALDGVLTEGYYMLKGAKGFTDVWRDLLIVAVMVTTQESDDDPRARVTDQYGHVHIGLFQQDSTDGSSWRNRGGGTGTDIAADAHAFFEVAVQERRAYPSYPRAAIALLVQNPGGSPDQYGQWQDEATATVEAWLPHDPLRSGVKTHYTGGVTKPKPLIPTNPMQFQYTRGAAVTRNNRRLIVRESNWKALQRLANEVNWRCFAVGSTGREVGVVYFGPDSDWFSSRPVMSFSDDDDGVDSITGEWDIGKTKATLNVACRISRWQAPPGSVVVVREHGPQSGRWLVASISRSLFSPTATVTLTKPQPALPSSGQPRIPKKTKGGKGPGGPLSALRQAIVDAALKAAATRFNYFYVQHRPMPPSLFGGEFPEGIDCSAFATLCYKAAGAPNPSGGKYTGYENTGTMIANGRRTPSPQPADLIFYGQPVSYPHHVAVYIGDGKIVNMGGPNEPVVENVSDVPLEHLGYYSYLTP
jgi:cell wall-associated NlpC family hydrolase